MASKSLGRFTLSMLKIGCIGFGGGSALIPVIEQEIVKGQKIDGTENLDKDVVVASITPGALPVEISASIGWRNFGIPGLLLGAFGMALPGTALAVLALTVLSMAQRQFLAIVETAAVGVSAFIILLLSQYIAGTLRTCREDSSSRFYKALAVMSAVFLLNCGKNIYALLGIDRTPIFSVSAFHILVLAFFFVFYTRNDYRLGRIIPAGILGVLYILCYGKSQLINETWAVWSIQTVMLVLAVWGAVSEVRSIHFRLDVSGRRLRNVTLIWICVLSALSAPALAAVPAALSFMGRGLLSALMSFGGGDAYLAIADGLFVDSGLISEAEYYSHVVNIVNVLPGSILCKTLAGIGYCIGLDKTGSTAAGLMTALCGFACSVAASCGFYCVIYELYDQLTDLRMIRTISRWIRPIVAGLLLNIMVSMVCQGVRASDLLQLPAAEVTGVLLALAAADILAVRKFHARPFVMLAVNLAAVFLIF